MNEKHYFRFLLTLLVGIFVSVDVLAQDITVKGNVKDTYGEPIILGAVQVKGTSKGCTTDYDGNFTLNVPRGATLVFSYVGFRTQELPAQPTMTVVLEEDTKMLEEAVVIGSGDLEAPITTAGGDEISVLATEMDNMRHAVIERMGNEKRAWEANSELITAISHDIRTPMTSLIGYLGLLTEGNGDAESRERFAASAYAKALELKELTDELFKYFLVFGRSELEMERERYDARLLLEQLVGEAAFDLSDAGFEIRQIPFEGECTVVADAMYLKRVMDNLVTNAKKYADKKSPVVFLSELSEGRLSLCVSNVIAKNVSRVESTKIGLRTCTKIMQAMGGSFSSRIEDDHYSAEFSLPAEAAEST